MRHIEIIDLLVRSDIQSTNDNFFAGHILSYGLVNLELLFLCRIVFFFQVYELTSEKSDAFRIIGKYIRNITCTSDVGIKVELTTALGNSFFTFQFFEHCTLCKFIGTHILIFFKGLCIRLNDQISALSVYDCHLTVHGLIVFNIDQRRNIHGSRKNRSM